MRHFEFGKLNVISSSNHSDSRAIRLDMCHKLMEQCSSFEYRTSFAYENDICEHLLNIRGSKEIFVVLDNENYDDNIRKFLVTIPNNIPENAMIIFETSRLEFWNDLIRSSSGNIFKLSLGDDPNFAYCKLLMRDGSEKNICRVSSITTLEGEVEWLT